MYNPKAFEIQDEQLIHQIIKENSFATVISTNEGIPVATHLPLTYRPKENALYGHFAVANKQWQLIEAQSVLVIFHGPHSYISPSWYETTNAVPTWNYVTVHIYGRITIIEDDQIIQQMLLEQIEKYESTDSSYSLSLLDEKLLRNLKKGIKPFKLEIDKIEAKAKLSQNHSEERQQLVIAELEKTTKYQELQIAQLMKARLK